MPIQRFKTRRLAKAKSSLGEIKREETSEGFTCSVSDSFQISFDGNIVCATRINSDKKWELAKADLSTGKCLRFPQVHSKHIETVVLAEELNAVLSGGGDGLAVIYDFRAGKVLHRVDMGIGEITAGLKAGAVAVLGGAKKVGFVNLSSGNEIECLSEYSLDCSYALALSLAKKREKASSKRMLVVGGQDSSSLDFIRLDSNFDFIIRQIPSQRSSRFTL